MPSPPSHQTATLSRGSHQSPAYGTCVMELASMLAGEPFSDHPRSVCPIVASYLRALNDVFDDPARRLLYPYAAAAVGTAGDAGLRRRRLERCREAHEALRAGHGRVRRLLTGAGSGPQWSSALALEHFTLSLVRAFRRSGAGWERRALAFADELIALSPVTRTGRVPAATTAAPRRRSAALSA